MASSNRGLLIGCVAVGVLGGGCVLTGVVGAGAWFLFQRGDAPPPIAMPSFDPAPVEQAPAPIATAPAAPPVITPPGVVAPAIAPALAPAVAPVAALRTIRIESTPIGARVMDGSAQLGVTPMEFPFPSGSPPRALRLTADGYDPADLQLSEASSDHIAVTLTRSAPTVAVVRTTGSSGSTGSSAGSGSSGSGTSGSGTSGSGTSGSGSHSGTSGESRPVAATIRPVGGTATTGTGTGGTTRPARPARTGTLSHDDF